MLNQYLSHLLGSLNLAPLISLSSSGFSQNKSNFNFKKIKFHLKSPFLGFGKRDVKRHATLQPGYPLESRHDILRSSGQGDNVLLEDQGLLEIQLNFEISDRKALQIKSKSRQLKILYKVQTSSFKEFLNNYYNKLYTRPFDGSNMCLIQNVTQTFTGTIHGIPFSVELNEGEFGTAFNVSNSTYLKIVSYKVLEFYTNYLKTLPSSDPRVVAFANTNTLIDSVNLEKSQGLNLVEGLGDLFEDPSAANVPKKVSSMPTEPLVRGRRRQAPTTPVVKGTASKASQVIFNAFSPLPIGFVLVDSTESTNLPNFIISKLTQADIFKKDPTTLTHSIVLESRLTEDSVINETGSNPPAQLPYTFSYYEDQTKYQRVYVQSDFLAACLSKVVLQWVFETHSPRVIYKSLKFTSFERKPWSDDNRYCRSDALMPFDAREFFFRRLIVGQHTRDVVNTTTNLMFTAEFDKTNGNFYKTNRFITCSAFGSQSDVVDITYQQLWENLETGFGETVVLTDTPFVQLTPAFRRGPIIEISNNLFFRGLVSNAGSNYNNLP